MTAADYFQQLRAVVRRGRLWLMPPGSNMAALHTAYTQEIARVDGRVLDLEDEADPRTTVELLLEHERDFGLPDPDAPPPAGIEDRQKALTAKMSKKGGQSRQYFIDLAAALGYPITITEFRPSTCESTCETPCYEEDARFMWVVNGPATHSSESTCESGCEDPLRSIGNDILVAAITRHQPAHTLLLFSFT